MGRALFIVDVQNDFTEGGALGVSGGNRVAENLTRFLEEHAADYDCVIASRDWHDGTNDNGGHFALGEATPNFIDSWPAHCIAGTPGAEYHPSLNTSFVDYHVMKGQGKPAYSLFEGATAEGATVDDLLTTRNIEAIDVTGIATDYCVRASALDAVHRGKRVRVLADLVAGVAPESSSTALAEIESVGGTVTSSTDAS